MNKFVFLLLLLLLLFITKIIRQHAEFFEGWVPNLSQTPPILRNIYQLLNLMSLQMVPAFGMHKPNKLSMCSTIHATVGFECAHRAMSFSIAFS